MYNFAKEFISQKIILHATVQIFSMFGSEAMVLMSINLNKRRRKPSDIALGCSVISSRGTGPGYKSQLGHYFMLLAYCPSESNYAKHNEVINFAINIIV